MGLSLGNLCRFCGYSSLAKLNSTGCMAYKALEGLLISLEHLGSQGAIQPHQEGWGIWTGILPKSHFSHFILRLKPRWVLFRWPIVPGVYHYKIIYLNHQTPQKRQCIKLAPINIPNPNILWFCNICDKYLLFQWEYKLQVCVILKPSSLLVVM